MTATLSFLGGTGTVTGSKHLLRVGGRQLLLDCGLFQGLKALRQRNWERPPFDARALDAVVVSHAHIDHAGYLPILVRRGFKGRVHTSQGTASLLPVVLRDAARLQEEDALRANRHGYSKHHPARPLFEMSDVERVLDLVEGHDYSSAFAVADGVRVVLRRAGHILGSASVDVAFAGANPLHVVFSGDLGRWGRPILRDPELVHEADVVMIESTYGDRLHTSDPDQDLTRVVSEAVARGGMLIVPAFAIGRTQELLWRLSELMGSGRVPRVPVWLDSPMGIAVTDVYCRHPEDHDLDMRRLMAEGRCPLQSRDYAFARTPDESRALNDIGTPGILIAGSGMATGGRVLHHLALRLPDPRTTVLLPGFQAAGTRGRALQEGAESVRIHGQDVPVRAHVETIDSLSAHADRNDLLRWLRGFVRPPAHAWVVHGEPQASAMLAEAIRVELGWSVAVAADGACVPLAG